MESLVLITIDLSNVETFMGKKFYRKEKVK